MAKQKVHNITELRVTFDKASGKGGITDVYRVSKEALVVPTTVRNVIRIAESPDQTVFMIFYNDGLNKAISRKYVVETEYTLEEVEIEVPDLVEDPTKKVVSLDEVKTNKKKRPSTKKPIQE